MIKYQLNCGDGCSFEGWFRSSDDFEVQADKARLECPLCGSTDIRRAIMAPAVMKRNAVAPEGRGDRVAMHEAMADAARRARDYVEKNFDYVGDQFPEEARRIHYGESDARNIFGEASKVEVAELVEEGVPVAPVPGASAGGPGKKRKIN